jgi:hypothetical protein
MNRHEITNIIANAERVLREEANAAVLAKPIAKRLEREYLAATKRVNAARSAQRAIETKAKRAGLQFNESYYNGKEHVRVAVYADRVALTAKQRRLKELRNELQIVRMGAGPESIKEQQAIFRQIAKLAPPR